MKVAHNTKLLRLIQFIPPLLVTAFAVMTIFVVVNNNQANLERDIQSLRKDFIASRKSMAEAQIKQLVQQIHFEKNNTEAVLKENIKQHIYQAHAIATRIYKENQDKSEQQVTKLIKDALRDIRFNQGRGYFFIYKTTGESVLHPVLTEIEGTQKLDLKDTRGNYIVRDMGKGAREFGEVFYTWWFVKPDNQSQEFQKIGFGKHFAPYDWFIGTGEYVADVESDIKAALINRIANIRYGENGYIFLMEESGAVLSHLNKQVENTNLSAHPNSMISDAGREILSAAQQGGGFITYQIPAMPTTGLPAIKTSYIEAIKEWQWVIGTGFFESEIDTYLEVRKLEVSQQNSQQLIELLWLAAFVTLFFIILTFLLTKNLSKRFMTYEDKINKDFDELNHIKQASQYQAEHDALTKLPNRVLLEEQISSGIARTNAADKMMAIIFVDLDDFKKVNDLHGHSVGDGLLKLLGGLFNNTLDSGDSVARFGGDEFIFCCPELQGMAEAQQKVDKILAVFKQQFDVEGKLLYSTGSIGVAMYPKDGAEPEELVSKADTALYTSKLRQKGQALFFNEGIEAKVKRDFMIETELRGALENQEITVFYQPQIGVKSGELIGVEALVRWQNPMLGFVSPAEFIPIAESTGVIKELGSFVLKHAMQHIKAFNQKHAINVNLSVNISPTQLLAPEFVQTVLLISNEVGLSPELVTLEITENVLISDLTVVQPILHDLKSYGFKLSLDDFGTGYSSLSYLSNLPMNEIKIDRSFIDKFLTNPQSESLVKTIIAIGEFCGLTVVAEGVETKAQYARLAEYNCDLIQGYYFDKPMTYDALTEKYLSCQVS